jgi:RHS repeat-associated protein
MTRGNVTQYLKISPNGYQKSKVPLVKFSEIANRLTGISTPLVGVLWQPTEVSAARRVIAFLEDRRVLYAPEEMEVASHCVGVQYTGREFDAETGLNYNRARYYNPITGRFISEDPLVFSGGGPNFYAYVGNDPVLFIDPTGLCTNNPRPPCHASNSFTDKTIRFFSLWRLPETWKEWVIGGGAKYTYVKALQAGATSAGGAESAGAAAIEVAGRSCACWFRRNGWSNVSVGIAQRRRVVHDVAVEVQALRVAEIGVGNINRLGRPSPAS